MSTIRTKQEQILKCCDFKKCFQFIN